MTLLLVVLKIVVTIFKSFIIEAFHFQTFKKSEVLNLHLLQMICTFGRVKSACNLRR